MVPVVPAPRALGAPGHPSAPVPPLPGLGENATGYRGVRHSTPIPPIPGRDTRLPGGGDAPAGTTRTGRTGSTRAARRAPVSPRRRRLVRAGLALGVLATLVVAGYVGLYFWADRSIGRVAALDPGAAEVLAPQLQAGDETWLVVGTGRPGQSGAAATTALVAHVSGDGEAAVLVDVPPTALLDTPECRTPDGEVRAPVTEQVAGALGDGGPACLVRAVQQLSGLRVDHYLAVDLGRLPDLTDALGDVAACPGGDGDQRLTAPQVGELLSPGATGADVTAGQAAQRGEQVLTATVQEAFSLGQLIEPVSLVRYLSRAADALTVDEATSLGELRSLAGTIGDLDPDAVQRTGLPVERVGYLPAGGSAAMVLVDGAATRELFDAVIETGRLPEAAASAAAAAPADDAAAADDAAPAEAAAPVDGAGATAVTVPAFDVTVDVLDATGAAGAEQAGAVATGLAGAGFRTGGVGVEPGPVQQTLVRYRPDALARAQTVAAAVPGAVLQPSEAVGDAVQLVVAAEGVQVQPVAVGTPLPAGAATPAPAADPAACG